MIPLIAIYRAPESSWVDACQWAKENHYRVFIINERCYRGVNHRATLYYANGLRIVADYAINAVPRLTDEDMNHG